MQLALQMLSRCRRLVACWLQAHQLVVRLALVLELRRDLELALRLDLGLVRHLVLDQLVLGLLGLLMGPLLYFLVYIVNNTPTLTPKRPQCKCFYCGICLYLTVSAYYYLS